MYIIVKQAMFAKLCKLVSNPFSVQSNVDKVSRSMKQQNSLMKFELTTDSS